MPVSRTATTTDEANEDRGQRPEDVERWRKEGVWVMWGKRGLSGTTARMWGRRRRAAAWGPVKRAAKPMATRL
ncbi:hypothetical protein IEQ34_019969 [Dendrobium chrysotoxum]|uniref:Uncharacterized protein n=1 Tax=Dendrobium chrysotoxum TaxID=161865 RepID=A0AAV7FSN9_DENCH|nr:hypothetical protein IEQ34_019969 [Dendrobium chrysotoxum]